MKFKNTKVLLLVGALLSIIALIGCENLLGGDISAPGPDGGPTLIALGGAGNFAILAESAITTTGATDITGDVGLSPNALSDTVGFSPALDGTGTFATSVYVTGKIYTADMTAPTPAELTSAVADMGTAYTNAAGLLNPDATELGSGEIGGLTIEPGLYKWGTGLAISSDVTLSGSDTATWIFQVAGNLTVSSGVQIILSGGALPANILWQIGSNATLGTTSKLSGTLMTGTDISVGTGATINGRLLAQTAVTMDTNTITEP